jgi:hypothetical protein
MRASVTLAPHDGYSISLCEPGASGEGLIEPVLAEGAADPGQEICLRSPQMRPRWLADPSAQAV